MKIGDIIQFIHYGDYGYIYKEYCEMLWINAPVLNPFNGELVECDFVRTDEEMDSNFKLVTDIFRDEPSTL